MAREIEDPAVISADATTTLELTRECRGHLISFENSGTLVSIATVHHKEVLQLACLVSGYQWTGPGLIERQMSKRLTPVESISHACSLGHCRDA